jgi:hypothetical protein
MVPLTTEQHDKHFNEVLTFLCDGLIAIAERVVDATNQTENLSIDDFISTLEQVSELEFVAKERLRTLCKKYYGEEVADKAWACCVRSPTAQTGR